MLRAGATGPVWAHAGVASAGSDISSLHPLLPWQVGSLLKLWLQDLPDPLLNWDEQVELLSACKDEGSIEQRVSALNDGLAMVRALLRRRRGT